MKATLKKKRPNKQVGVSLIEVILAMSLCIPLLYIVWSAMIGGRKTEQNTIAFASALRGSATFEEYVRRDLSSMSASAKENAIKISEDKTTITIVTSTAADTNSPLPPSGGTASYKPFTLVKEVRYKMIPHKTIGETKFFSVKRDEHILANVILSDIDINIVRASPDSRVQKWIIIDYTAYDPGLTKKKNDRFNSFSNTILESLPISNISDGFADYEEVQTVPPTSGAIAWVEGIDDRYIYIGACNRNSAANLPTLSVDINNNNYPIVFPDRPENHLETLGTAPYLTMAFDYHVAMKLTGGPNYMNNIYKLTIYVTDQEVGTANPFFEISFLPSASNQFDLKEVELVSASFRHSFSEKGLDLFLLSTTEIERPCYRILYKSTGEKRKALASNVSSRYFHAFLPDFPDTGNIGNIQIENSFLRDKMNQN
jgi:hypothetical protein